MGKKYVEKVHQSAFTSQFSLKLARERSSSFDKFYRDTVRLLTMSPTP
ncbi:MAG TPA: hypothetical protein VG406_22655 [Isosphaeraceae bacterium]|jgi:hypothetical protein|nr:hypothetical protein [Isosphaeraceae bacterium]